MQITRGVSDPSIFLEEVVELIIGTFVSSKSSMRGLMLKKDMFNDEMHSVRLMAVQSLAQLGQSSLVPIVESQLLFVLTAFNDASEEIREGTFLALR